jgi:glycosyltransferase involved in cell wall biosynthesis
MMAIQPTKSPVTQKSLRKDNEIQRVVVLFSRLSGYMAACLKTLKERYNVELLVFCRPPANEAPFETSYFDWIDEVHDRNQTRPEDIDPTVSRFGPQAVLMSGWLDPAYLRTARSLRRRGIPVVAGSDAQWTGSLRQHLACLTAPWYLHKAIDVLWVAGRRQENYARRLGYTGIHCWTGIYACDWEQFAANYSPDINGSTRAFLFVGRYLERKGLDVLVEGYQAYRSMVSDPWPLICAGAGEYKTLLEGREGIIDRGFTQPSELPELMADASAFVLPSRWEPWGVVVQEAAATGLPLLCSDACGAADHLLQDGLNGYLFRSGDAQHLASAMANLTQASAEERQKMGARSFELSKQYTPECWADTFVQGIRSLQKNNR